MALIHETYLPDSERLGRMLKNAFGVEEVVSLAVKHWKHFDWMAEQGKDMDEWLKKLDLERHSHKGFIIDFEGYIEMGLVMDERRRHQAGENVPLFINPHRIVD